MELAQTVVLDDLSDEMTQWVTFHLGTEKYGINVMQVQEVLRNTEITPVPGAADFVLGIINLRGNVVTVIDTCLRFNLSSREETEDTRIIVIEANKEQVVGLVVDSVAEVVDFPESKIETSPNVGSDESSKFIQGVFSEGDDLLILVDIDKLLTEDEWAEMDTF